jgi:hypothetical protein
VAFRHIRRRLDDDGLQAEIDEGGSVKRIVVRGDDDALRRRQVIRDAPADIDRRARADAEHQAGPVLHQLPHTGAAEHVDCRVAPVIDDAGERLDVLLIGELRRHPGRPGQIAMRGIEGPRHIRDLGVLRIRGLRHGQTQQDGYER